MPSALDVHGGVHRLHRARGPGRAARRRPRASARRPRGPARPRPLAHELARLGQQLLGLLPQRWPRSPPRPGRASHSTTAPRAPGAPPRSSRPPRRRRRRCERPLDGRDLEHLPHALHRLRRAAVQALRLAAEGRAARHHREEHAGHAHVEAEDARCRPPSPAGRCAAIAMPIRRSASGFLSGTLSSAGTRQLRGRRDQLRRRRRRLPRGPVRTRPPSVRQSLAVTLQCSAAASSSIARAAAPPGAAAATGCARSVVPPVPWS